MISSVLKAGRAEAISRKSYVMMQSAYEVQHSGADDDRRNVNETQCERATFKFVRLLNRDRHCGQLTASVRAWTDVTHESLSFLHFTSVT